jgi:hypothetical protein
MIGLGLVAVIWLIAIAPITLAVWLLGAAWAAIGAAVSLLLVALRPALRSGTLAAGIGGLGLAATIAMAAAALGVGRIDIDARLAALREADRNALALEVEDRHGRWLGVLPQSLMPPAARDAAHIGIPVRPAEIPPLWWRCARFLEDRRIEEPWHYLGIDFIGLVRAYLGRVTGRTYEGGSTISQMVARALRGVSPDPEAGLPNQLLGKWRAWGDGPAIARLYPDVASLGAAAASHIVLATGAGGDIHGVALASRALFGRSHQELEAAEQLLLAAAIWRPIRLSASAVQPETNRKRFDRIKKRAARCLPLIDEEDTRRRANDRLAALVLSPPQPPAWLAAILPSDPATRVRIMANPASRANWLAGSALREVPHELVREFGADWHRQVARVRLTISGGANVDAALAMAALRAERAIGDRLRLSLWSGEESADSMAAVVDGAGEIVALATNRYGGLALTGPQPVGSLAKIAAALVLGRTDQPDNWYCRRPGCEARRVFARSAAPPLLRRLARVDEADLARAIRTLGWAVPAGESARRHAVFGGFEETPAAVLRAIAAVTGNLAGRPRPVAVPHMVRAMTLREGSSHTPEPASLPVEPLAAIFAGPARAFTASVLAAPIEERSGTAHALAAALSRPGIALRWAKTGTANTVDNQLTRTTWVAGGFVYRDEPLAFLVMVTAPSNRTPLGHVQAREVSVPLATALLSATLSRISPEDLAR